MADHISPEHRSWNMQQIKAKDTKIEVQVRSWLFSKGFRFKKMIKDIQGNLILYCQSIRRQFLLMVVFGIDMKDAGMQQCQKRE